MTHTAWNTTGNDARRVDIRSACVLLFLALWILAFPSRLPAAEKPAQPSLSIPSTPHRAKDVEIEARILQTFRKDPQLRLLNLGVHISGGVAKLSGPVPTLDLKQRVVRIVQEIDGVLTVRTDDLYISSSAQGRKRVSVVVQDDLPSQTRAASLPKPSNASGVPGETASPSLAASTQNSAIRTDTAGAGQQITLMAPEIPTPPRHAPEAARLTGNSRPPSPSVSISAAIERLRKQDARYQLIHARVEGTTVYIIPGETAGEDVMMFAQAVRRLPGVRHIVIDSSSR